MHGRAHLLSKNEAEVVLDDGTKERIRAKKILLATGGHPNIPKTPGSELGITSDGFFDLEKRPEKVALVGAGYIAVEMAGMFHHLGSETHLFIRHDKFLRNFDPMIQDKIMSEYERQYVFSPFQVAVLYLSTVSTHYFGVSSFLTHVPVESGNTDVEYCKGYDHSPKFLAIKG